MKVVHTQKKSANRPFIGVQKSYGYNCYNSKTGVIRDNSSQKPKRTLATYKRKTSIC